VRFPRLQSLRGGQFLPHPDPLVRYTTQHPLRRVLAFTGRTIDDVVNDPIAKNQVLGYYRVLRQIDRRSEIRDLESQWNPKA
jgi:hypothetical protein